MSNASSDKPKKPTVKEKVVARAKPAAAKQRTSTKPTAAKQAPVATVPTTTPTNQYSAVNWGPWRGLLMIVVSFIGAQVVVAILVTAIPWLLQLSDSQAQAWLDSNASRFLFVVAAEALALVILWRFLKHRHAANLAAVGLTRPAQWSDVGYSLIGGAVYFALFILVTVIASTFIQIDLEQQQEIGFETTIGPAGKLMAFAALVILPPLVEEILFRGVLFGGLRRKLPFIWATVFTGLAFAAPHLLEGKGGGLLWVAGIDTFVLSFVLCYLREKTGSLWASIGLHTLKNGIAFGVLFIFPYLST